MKQDPIIDMLEVGDVQRARRISSKRVIKSEHGSKDASDQSANSNISYDAVDLDRDIDTHGDDSGNRKKQFASTAKFGTGSGLFADNFN